VIDQFITDTSKLPLIICSGRDRKTKGRTLWIHPTSTTHCDLSPIEQNRIKLTRFAEPTIKINLE